MEITLTFPPERKHDLEQLQTVTSSSLEELFNHALSVFEWAVNESRAQNQIASVNERDQSYRVLINQLLQRAAASVQSATETKQGKVA